jgi:hypothetical protein
MALVLVSIDVTLIPPESLQQLLSVYQAVIFQLPLLVDAKADDEGARFRSSRVSAQLGSAALACALAADKIELGLELLEQARAVFWAQAIAAQYLDLGSLPEPLHTQITELLSMLDPRGTMSAYWIARTAENRHSRLTHESETHKNLMRLRKLLDDARAMPGLERFMLGPTCATLMRCAVSHPVVILSADHNSCHALLLLPGNAGPISLALLDVTGENLERMAVEIRDVGLRSRAAEQDRAISVSRRQKSTGNSSTVLARLWRLVVKPIFDIMKLSVSCNWAGLWFYIRADLVL